MSRSGYVDDNEDQWALIRYRGAVKSALKGSRGQAFLRELIEAMDAMPTKALAQDQLKNASGAYCTLGVIGAARGIDLDALDPGDIESVAAKFGLSDAMAREIVYQNDEAAWRAETPEARWARMRGWAASWIAQGEPS